MSNRRRRSAAGALNIDRAEELNDGVDMAKLNDETSGEMNDGSRRGLTVTMLCIGCGYALDHLAEHRCPECGRGFGPEDVSTYRRGAAGSWWRRYACPPSKAECWIAVIVSLLALMGVSGPAEWEAGCIRYVWGLVSVLLAIAAFGSFRLATRLGDRGGAERYGEVTRRGRWRWAVVPVCMVAVLSSFVEPWPLKLRFAVSRPAFERIVREFDENTYSGGQLVGLYYVQKITTERSAFGNGYSSLQFQSGLSSFGPVGFVYGSSGDSHCVDVAPGWSAY